MSYYNYQSKNIFYEEIGTGKPLLLLHGNTASSNMFLNIANQYAEKYKVILIDFLGHGKSDRLDKFPVDLWYEEAQQVIEFLSQKKYAEVFLLGSSGGALVAINIALERPDLVSKVIADSFEGTNAIDAFTANIVNDRDFSKQNEGARMFYQAMQGDDWESVVDNDTNAIFEHSKLIGKFFHKPISTLQADILMTGSNEDVFITCVDTEFYRKIYSKMIKEIGHGDFYLFEHGGHPAMLSNQTQFIKETLSFLERD
ncbi:alpha/beta fold hydrolase [Anaerocolumna sedimenticola]|uniref:Alpha/beta fold hydrolase n=1 Tax=Anaerocolumna sedimenticola TaxID=2696063 RepID=A0A6P1TTU6_9FIRM|nr:alpha/beta hydrolase [Anaerocolumna sedimenticola]QHQ62918.1 alpha/beta fold hydrolase [Anaerocolumna sedimenticola]